MKKLIFIILFISIFSYADNSEFSKPTALEENYNYSSDVIHAVLIENAVSASNGRKCNVRYSKFKVVESFKGRFNAGDIFMVSGINTHEGINVGQEQLLLLIPFVASHFPEYGNCIDSEYNSYLSIDKMTLPINTEGEKSFIVYKLLDSQHHPSQPYYIPVEKTFQKLRKLKKSLTSR